MNEGFEKRKEEVMEDFRKLVDDVFYLHMTVAALLAELEKIETDAQALAWQEEVDKMIDHLKIIRV